MLRRHKIISPLTRGSEQFGGANETLMSLKIASLPCEAKFSALKEREIFINDVVSSLTQVDEHTYAYVNYVC